MTNNVYKFPGADSVRVAHVAEPKETPKVKNGSSGSTAGKKVLSGVVTCLWFVVALVWPVLRWFFALDVVFRALVMAWHWDNPGSYSGWTFVLHFAAFAALTFFVSVFKPKNIK